MAFSHMTYLFCLVIIARSQLIRDMLHQSLLIFMDMWSHNKVVRDKTKFGTCKRTFRSDFDRSAALFQNHSLFLIRCLNSSFLASHADVPKISSASFLWESMIYLVPLRLVMRYSYFRAVGFAESPS